MEKKSSRPVRIDLDQLRKIESLAKDGRRPVRWQVRDLLHWALAHMAALRHGSE